MWKRTRRMYYTLEELAELSGIPYGTLNHRVHIEKSLRRKKYGQVIIFSQAQLDQLKEKGFTDLDVDTTDVYSTAEAVDYLNTVHGLGISRDALIAARHHGAIRHEAVGGTAERTALVLFHRDDLDIYAAQRGGREGLGLVIRDRRFFSPSEAESYTDVVLGQRIPRNSLLYHAGTTKTRHVPNIHPEKIEGVLVFSAEQLADFVSNNRQTDITIDRNGILTPAEAAELLGVEAQVIRQYMFIDAKIPYEPVGVSDKGAQLYLLRREDVEALGELNRNG